MEVISLLATEGNEKIMKEHPCQAWQIEGAFRRPPVHR